MRLTRFLIIFFLSACNISDTPPNWFLNPPKDSEYFYGVGQGKTKIAANLEAQNDIISQLNKIISEAINSEQEEITIYSDNPIYEERVNRSMIAKIAEMKLPKYELVKSKVRSKKTYSLIKIERKEILRYFKSNVWEIDDRISKNLKNIDKFSEANQFVSLTKIRLRIRENRANLRIIEILSGNSEFLMEFKDKYKQLMDREKKLKTTIKIKITSKDQDRRIVDLIKKELEKMQIQIVEEFDQNQTKQAVLRINATTTNQKIGPSFSSKTIINFRIAENLGQILSINEVEIRGNSAKSIEDAYQISINNLQKKIKAEGLMKTMGIIEGKSSYKIDKSKENKLNIR